MKRFLIKAMLRRCLPLTFSNFCYPVKGTFNGVRFLFVYVEPKFFKQLFSTKIISFEGKELWAVYFVGFGLREVEESDFDLDIRANDWTFQGDDENRPIVNLEVLDRDEN